MQKIIRSVMQSLFIAIMMVMGLSCSACALNATVPASLPISVSSNGTVSTATNMKISNYDSNPVENSSMNVTAQNGWEIGSRYSAMKAAINDKIFAIAFNNNWLQQAVPLMSQVWALFPQMILYRFPSKQPYLHPLLQNQIQLVK